MSMSFVKEIFFFFFIWNELPKNIPEKISLVSMVVFEVSKSRIMEPEEDTGSMLTKRKLTIHLQLYTLWGLLRK